MQSTSWGTLGWIKHKLESRLLGEISITSDMQMTPPLWQKVKVTRLSHQSGHRLKETIIKTCRDSSWVPEWFWWTVPFSWANIFISIWDIGLMSFNNTSSSIMGFPDSSTGKESTCNAGDPSSIPGWGRSPGEGNGNTLQYSCLENPMHGGAWWATVHGGTKSWTWLND